MAITPEELVENFSFLETWEERYSHIIDLGKKLPPLDQELKTDENRLQGCVSTVWFKSTPYTKANQTCLHFAADSDALIVKGLIGLLFELCQDQPATLITQIPFEETMEQIGLSSHLSPNRRSGFASMLGYIRNAASQAS